MSGAIGDPGDRLINSPIRAKQVKEFHTHDDVDAGNLSHHHTLGIGVGQAAPGDRFKVLLDLFELINSTFARYTKVATAQSIADVTFVALTFPTDVNTSTPITISGARDTITVVEEGIYLIHAFATWPAAAAGRRILRINSGGEQSRVNVNTSAALSQGIGDVLLLAAGATVKIEANHNVGVAVNISDASVAIKRIG